LKLYIFNIQKFDKKMNNADASKRKVLDINMIFLSLLILNCLVFLMVHFRSAFAGQGHENCHMCHRAHSAYDLFLFPEFIIGDIMNPHTGKEMDKIDALCMKCHASPPYGKGIREIDPNHKHPFGIEPFLVNLPEKASGFNDQTQRLTCLGCHDPHPSNQNLSYLRVPSKIKIVKAEDIIKSCLWCHPNMKTVFDFLPQKSLKFSKPKKKPKASAPSSIGGISF
jgi:hypothetical protein